MRPIDADALESIIQEQVGKCMIKVFNPSVNLILQNIRNAPTIETEFDKGWISVKDRLPGDKERYLICIESGRVEIAYYQPIGDKFSNYEPFWQGSSCRFTSVTRWQPLPVPPKGE